MKNILIISNARKSSAGFTLIELLVAISLTTIVVSIAGFGLVAIMQNSAKAEAENSRRIELNRALDFMTDEVKRAKTVAKDASANLSTLAPGFDSTDKKPVLTLEISGVAQRIIYYIASPSSDWRGPKVIYRWGPDINDSGQYTNTDNVPIVGNNNPKNWSGAALVDLIANTTPTSATACLTPIATWSANPSSSNGQGFTACVDPTGKIAEIYLRGHLTDAHNNPLQPYPVKTKVFARGN